jgi:3'(2'), 5'-bisphosphate nucleotidase
VVAEEEVNTLTGRELRCPRTWVLDPLDGTSQFLDPAGTEYCSTVAVLHGNMPVACLIYCPQLSRDGSEVVIAVNGPGQPPIVNNSPAEPMPRSGAATPDSVSATRARRDPPRSFESKLAEAGTMTKLRATSLSLDMARTCIDLSGPTGLHSFRWFHRANQRAWDSLAGIVLAHAAGLAAVDLRGASLAPLPDGFLEDPEPVFPHTVLASGDEIRGVLELLRGA